MATSKKSAGSSVATGLSRLALYNPGGKRRRCFDVQEVVLSSSSAPKKRKVGHHIIVLDRSGSMYGVIDVAKAQIEKVCTLAEYKSPNLKFSFVTYSDNGDCVTHFAGVSAEDVMAMDSKYIKAIRNVRATCMTGMSQALVAAEKLVNDDETTVISLHTDGYANDPSPMQERRTIEGLLSGKLKSHPSLIVNTVAHGNYADTNLLMQIANSMSGTFVQANDVTAKALYDTLHKTNKLLAGDVAPELEIPAKPDELVVFVSRSAGKVLGGHGTLNVRGLAPTDDRTAYRFIRVTDEAFDASKAPLASLGATLAFARASLALGQINDAKYALVATRDSELIERHLRALSSDEIASMASDLESIVLSGDGRVDAPRTASYGVGGSGVSVMDILGILSRNTDHFSVPGEEIWKDYQRMGLKKVFGTRAKGTTEVLPIASRVEPSFPNEDLKVHNFETNNATANVNMLTSQRVHLFDNTPKKGRAKAKPIPSIEGIPLENLRSYRNVTIVGDGKLRVANLPLHIFNKKLHTELINAGVSMSAFDPKKLVRIPLSQYPLIGYNQNFTLPSDTATKLASLTVVSKLLAELSKSGENLSYSGEQIAALRARHISTSLYYNPPTVNKEADTKAALAAGRVDTRLSYEIRVGTPEITDLSKLHSANEVLRRRFSVTVDGKALGDKASFGAFIPGKTTIEVKTLSKQTKLTPVDELEYPIYASALGLEHSRGLVDVLTSAGVDLRDALRTRDAIIQSYNNVSVGNLLTATERAEIINTSRRIVDDLIEQLYANTVRPLVFYIGATGVLPDELGAKALTADQLAAQFPNIKLSETERDTGTFFLIGSQLISVFTEGVYFTTEKGLREIDEDEEEAA